MVPTGQSVINLALFFSVCKQAFSNPTGQSAIHLVQSAVPTGQSAIHLVQSVINLARFFQASS